VRQQNGEFKLTVADLASTGLDEKSVIDHAIKTLSRSATVKLNIPARIYQVYGRQLTLEGADGSRSMVAMFDFMDRLYQIEATVPPGGSEFELTRFQQSLVFEPGVSNRSPEEIRAIRAACPGNLPAWTIHAAKGGAECLTSRSRSAHRHIGGRRLRDRAPECGGPSRLLAAPRQGK
jgi:hypothetical protein